MKTKEPISWTRHGNGMYLDCPFLKEFQDEFKVEVPHDERKWDPKREQWWVSDLYLDEVDNLLVEHFERSGSGRD